MAGCFRPPPPLVVLDYTQVMDPSLDLSSYIELAYGAGALGVLAIRNVPGFVDAKMSVLTQAHSLAHLPADELLRLEDEKSLYNAGWSHGKEKLGDKPDFAKGSFYFNPLTDTPGSAEDRAKFPVSYPCNVWPTSTLPNFEPCAKTLGKIMHDQVVALSVHIDKYAASKVPTYKPFQISDAMRVTEKAKGRLLYYFPLPPQPDMGPPPPDSWIGWHNDSGYLTALAGDMYVDDRTGVQVPLPDPLAGLYVVDRSGDSVRVEIPSDCMAVQLGECVQVVTGGVLVATPHCVRGATPTEVPVARVSHPCFIDCVPTTPITMPEGCTMEQVFGSGTDSKVPPLEKRWTHDGMLFGDFLQKTFSMYYEHTLKK